MKDEDKIILAENTMEWVVRDGSFFPKTEWNKAPDPFPLSVKEWNPDVNIKYFKEVLGNLTEKQQNEVWYLTWKSDAALIINSKNFNMISIWVWIYEHKEEVIEAVLEVLK